MKKIQNLFLIILMLAVSVSCTEPDNVEVKTKTIVKGKIENLDVYPNTRIASVSIVDFRGKKRFILTLSKAMGHLN